MKWMSGGTKRQYDRALAEPPRRPRRPRCRQTGGRLCAQHSAGPSQHAAVTRPAPSAACSRRGPTPPRTKLGRSPRANLHSQTLMPATRWPRTPRNALLLPSGDGARTSAWRRVLPLSEDHVLLSSIARGIAPQTSSAARSALASASPRSHSTARRWRPRRRRRRRRRPRRRGGQGRSRRR